MQKLIIESKLEDFKTRVEKHLSEGFKLVVGSTYIISLESDISILNGEILYDVEHIFTLGIIDNNKEFFIISQDIKNFIQKVNTHLKNGTIITGSAYFSAHRLDNYVKQDRIYDNYFSCCVYRS